jgi:hypothetical protein
MGTVYLLGDYEREHYYKIGVTKGSVEKRIKKLQTGNASEIYLVNKYETKYPFFLETRLHQRFDKNRIKNEWFELSDDDVRNFEFYCKNVEEMIEALEENPFFPKNIK